jgi:DNA-binding winged helix-turn-helix (wHTH) protein
MMQRLQNKTDPQTAIGEDPIGDLLDRVTRGDSKAPQMVLESGFFGLLHKCYQLPFGTQSVIFDLHPGTIVLLDKGNVHLQSKGVNSVLRKIILLIKDEPKSKEQLVQEIWGYNYDPLRHDTLIYSSINKVRKLLAPHAEWIQLTESGYQIQKSVRIIIKNTLKQNSSPLQTAKTPQLESKNRKPKIQARWAKYAKDLNFRQMQIMDYLKTHPSISVQELSSRLLISKPTATRDLSKLYDLGILTRVGQGRATRYFL